MQRSEQRQSLDSETGTWDRVALGGGLAFGVLSIAAIFTAPSLPESDAPAAELAASYVANQTGHLISTYCSGLGAIAFLIFLGGLSGILRQAMGKGSSVPLLVFGGGVATVLLILAAQATYAGTALIAEADGVTPAVVRGLDGLVPALMLFSGFPRVVFLAASALAIMQTRIAPRWAGWLGLAVAGVNLIGTFAYFDIDGAPGMFGFLGVALFTLWVLVTSLTLVLRNDSRQPVTAPLGREPTMR